MYETRYHSMGWRLVLRAALAAVLAANTFAGPPTGDLSTGEGGQTPARPPLALVHNQFGALLPGQTSQHVRVAHTAQGFVLRASRLAARSDYVGTLEVRPPDPNQAAWVAPPGGLTHVRATVHDAAAIAGWAQAGVTPGYLLGIETGDLPPLSETAFVGEVLLRRGNGETVYVRFRVRSSDGVCAVAEVQRNGQVVPPDGGPAEQAAGPWWPVCCGSQWLLCELSRVISPGTCSDCYTPCLLRCLMGGSNPCHSCGACGLSDFLCRFIPGAHC